MNEKRIEKVCIDCINSNEHLKISTDFKVSVEFGTCDCCGKRYIIVPFRRFFSENTKITPCKQEVSKGSSVVKENPRVEELLKEQGEHIKLIRELQNKVGELEAKTQHQINIPESQTGIEIPITEPEKQQKPSKQKDINKAYE